MISSDRIHKDVDGFSDENPYRPPTSMDTSGDLIGFSKYPTFQIAAGLQCATIVGGVVAAFLDIESIMVSGAILSLVGIATAFFAFRSRYGVGIAFGLSGPGICVSCFFLIFTLGWGPADPQDPVSMITLLYGVLFVPLGIFAIVRAPSTVSGEAQSLDSVNSVDILS